MSLAVLVMVTLTGCGGGAAPVDVAKVVQVLMAAAPLAANRARSGRRAQHFLERRAIALTKANPGWATEQGNTNLVSRLNFEMKLVADYVDQQTALLLANDPAMPKHRDLRDAAKPRVDTGTDAVSVNLREFTDQRTSRIASIVWRACAIEKALWAGSESSLTPSLNTAALAEVLDRRLHAVEMLILHDEHSVGKWSVTTGPMTWKDQQRTSMFQYPWVRLVAGNNGFEAALTTAGLNVAGLAPDWTLPKPEEINYREMARVRAQASNEWHWDETTYTMSLAAGATPSSAMEHMIPTTPIVAPEFEDFLDRNLMYCDIMLAALHLQGLRFGRLRRTHSENDFNTAASAGITLRPLIPTTGPPDVRLLMTKGADWFDAVAVPRDELQVGDHLVFWNNQFVRFVLGSAFGLENSYVTRIDDDGYGVKMAGHGMTEKTQAAFADEMGDAMTTSFDAQRQRINQDDSVPVIGRRGPRPGQVPFQLVNWSPFGETFTPHDSRQTLSKPGAWWIRLKRQVLVDLPRPNQPPSPPPSMDVALAMIPYSVRVDLSRMQPPTLHAGDFDPAYQDSVYLPLSVPHGVRGGWAEYLEWPRPGEALTLVDLKTDGNMVPGFFIQGKGQNSLIPVLRPKVRV